MVLYQTRDGWFRPLKATSKEEQQQVDKALRSRLLRENSKLFKFLQLEPSEPEQQPADDGDHRP